MFRTTRIALVGSLLSFAVLNSTSAKADLLSLIKSQCNTLGATQYQIAFVTSDGTTATSGNIQDYNNFVSAEALSGSNYLSDFVPAGTTWKAIASTQAVDAINNAPTYGNIPLFNTLGSMIQPRSDYIWQADDHPLNLPLFLFTQYGTQLATPTWSGTKPNGRADVSFYLGNPYAMTVCGTTIGLESEWISESTDRSDIEFPLYALSSPIAIPEPSTFTLLGSALLGLGLACLRRPLQAA